ncbi:hypothetical protein K2173_000450 [Erythroxylum novogranatense]|uniref:Cyclic nucleotide-binding domain-containing protein n=1 Tax=Erythroxylum novogranatense TaxID=1862640 RepID=A0AAV8SXS8_9ROSI|nr:hypothetical protein K2173_000450 [Erythroxylum novogranatense]
MDLKKEKQVRFDDTQQDQHYEKHLLANKKSFLLLEHEGGKNGRKAENTTAKTARFNMVPDIQEPSMSHTIDPGSDVFLHWNRVFRFSCLLALFIDPLFFFIPSVKSNDSSSCSTTDFSLGITLACFRTLTDLLYIMNIAVKFQTAYIAPSSRFLGRGELVTDPKLIAKRYLKSTFSLDLIASLPLPQILIWYFSPVISPNSDQNNNVLVLIVLFQFFPRLYMIFPLSSKISKATGVLANTAWAGAAYNLLLFLLAGHILGAAWYLFSFERNATCWKRACMEEPGPVRCDVRYFDCKNIDQVDRQIWINSTLVFTLCDPDNGTVLNYGIFASAVTKNVMSAPFLEKYFYVLWWGLQNLSTYGNNLSTSIFVGETTLSNLISILGLVLFAQLIGNMETYLKSITQRPEEWRVKQRDTEEWMRHRQLPHSIRERVRRFVHYKWLATRGVDEDSILRGLPTDNRRHIKRHLCLGLVRRVQFFSQMDDQLLDAICERLISFFTTKDTCVVREGDPVIEMLFIVRGKLDSSTTDGGRSGFFNSITLSPGDFCGEELLSWALVPKSNTSLPSSTRTVKALEEVEAFALRAEDLKFVANQFRRLHNKELQHTFRFYSHHWRTWAACFIQAAWRSYKRRSMAKRLGIMEPFGDPLNEQMTDEITEEEELTSSSSPSPEIKHELGLFSFNKRKGSGKLKLGMSPRLQKPDEPDFSREPDDDD